MSRLQSGGKASKGRRILKVIFVLLVLLVLWGIAGYVATIPIAGNHPYWRALRAYPKDFGLQANDVSFSSKDGIPLKAWYIPAAGEAHGTVIIAHGINGNRSDMLSRAAFLVRDHYNTLLVDLRDHGESGGNYAGPGYMESLDIQGGLRYLQAHGQRGPFVAMGHSYGAVAALYSAAQTQDIVAVIADSAFVSFDDMVSRATILLAQDPERSFWERLGLRIAGFHATEWAVMPMYYLRSGIWMDSRMADSLLAIRRIGDRPILFIGGQEDKVCPPENAQLMYNAALSQAKALLIVPDADHDSTYSTDPRLYQFTVVTFLQRALATTVGRDEEQPKTQ